MLKKALWFAFYLLALCPLAAQRTPSEATDRIAALPYLTLPYQSTVPVADSLVLAWWSAADYRTLKKALRHTSPQVRIAAAMGLASRFENQFIGDLLEEAIPFLYDTAAVSCKVGRKNGFGAPQNYRCGELFFYFTGGLEGGAFHRHFPKPLSLPPDKKAALENLVVQSNTPLSCKTFLLYYKVAPPESWYASLQKQTEAGLNDASVCLARYQRAKDIPLILAHLPGGTLENGLSAGLLPFQYFRHPDMERYLFSVLDAHADNYQFYRIITPYKNDTARQILDQIYKRLEGNPKRQICLSSLRQAMQADYTPLYTPLLTTLMTETRNQYTLSRLPDSLWHNAREFTWNYLNNTIEAEIKRGNGLPFYPMPEALNYLYRNAPPDSLRIFIIRHIRPGIYYSNLIQIVKFAMLEYHPDYEDLFFQLLEHEKDGPHRFYYAKMLLAYNRPDMSTRLNTFFQTHPDLFPSVQDAETAGNWVSDTLYYLEEMRKNKGKKQ